MAVGFSSEEEAIDVPGPSGPGRSVTDEEHQRGLEALARAREGFDVLAEVVAGSHETVMDLERRLGAEREARAAAEAAVQDARTRELALQARLLELQRLQSPAHAARTAKVLNRDAIGRAGAGMQRFARSAAAETAKLRADLAHRAHDAAAELTTLRAERDRLAAALSGAEGERDDLRAQLDAANARIAELTVALEVVALAEPEAADLPEPDDRQTGVPEPAPPGTETETAAATEPEAERPAPDTSPVLGRGIDPTPIRFTLGAEHVEAAAVEHEDHAWARAGVVLLALGVIAAVAILVLTGYGSFCSGNACG